MKFKIIDNSQQVGDKKPNPLDFEANPNLATAQQVGLGSKINVARSRALPTIEKIRFWPENPGGLHSNGPHYDHIR